MALALPVERPGEDRVPVDLPDCVICLTSLVGVNMVYGRKRGSLDGCRHYFHLKCIKGAIENQELEFIPRHPTCPTCRQRIDKIYPIGHSGPVFTVGVYANKGYLYPSAYFIDTDDNRPVREVEGMVYVDWNGRAPMLANQPPSFQRPALQPPRFRPPTFAVQPPRFRPPTFAVQPPRFRPPTFAVQPPRFQPLQISRFPTPHSRAPLVQARFLGPWLQVQRFQPRARVLAPCSQAPTFQVSRPRSLRPQASRSHVQAEIANLVTDDEYDAEDEEDGERLAGSHDEEREEDVETGEQQDVENSEEDSETEEESERTVVVTEELQNKGEDFESEKEADQGTGSAEVQHEDMEEDSGAGDETGTAELQVDHGPELIILSSDEEESDHREKGDVNIAESDTNEIVQQLPSNVEENLSGNDNRTLMNVTESPENSESEDRIIQEDVSGGDGEVVGERRNATIGDHIEARSRRQAEVNTNRKRSGSRSKNINMRAENKKKVTTGYTKREKIRPKPRPGFGWQASPPDKGCVDFTQILELTKQPKFEYPCNHCGKAFNNRGTAMKHVQIVHLKTKFECFICKIKVVSKSNLNKHMLYAHPDNDQGPSNAKISKGKALMDARGRKK